MSLRYSGPAVLRCDAGVFPVHADLRTDVSGGVYSWSGRLHAHDLAAMRAARSGGALTLSVPPHPGTPAALVHIVHTDPHPGGGVQVRVHGNGRAPYERDGEIVTRPREGGGTVYQVAE